MKKIFLFKDLSGRGITSKLDEEHIRKTWELDTADEGDETLTLDRFLREAEIGDWWTYDCDHLIRID